MNRQFAVFCAFILVLVSVVSILTTLLVVHRIDVRVTEDHDLAAGLVVELTRSHVELARAKADLHETEVALDSEAIENLRLRDQLHLLDLQLKIQKDRHSL